MGASLRQTSGGHAALTCSERWFSQCLVLGELSLPGIALTGHPPKDGMAAKWMMLAGHVAPLTSARPSSHLPSDLAFCYTYGCCDKSVRVIKRRKTLFAVLFWFHDSFTELGQVI